MMRSVCFCSMLLVFIARGWAQQPCTHIDLQSGYAYFSGMSKKSGFTLNMGARYDFNTRFFAGLLVHTGLNRGQYTGRYAGEDARLDHRSDEYFVGLGPGLYLYHAEMHWAYAHVLLGYGFGEECRDGEEAVTTSLRSFGAAAQVGMEFRTGRGFKYGVNLDGYLIDGRFRPSVCLKFGFLLNL